MRRPASPTLPRDGRADFVRLFHTFSFWRDYFLHRPTWPTLPRDGRLPFVLHSFTHALVLADLVSAQAAARNLCRNGRPQSLVVHFTHICALEKLFLHRPSSGTLPGIGGSPFSAHFTHVFVPPKTFRCAGQPRRLYPATAVPNCSSVHFTRFCSGKNFSCTGQARQLYPAGAVPTSSIHSTHVFLLAGLVSAQAELVNLTP